MVLQYAIDVLDGDEALKLAGIAVDAGVTCLEAGHVLIKACGIGIVRELRSRFAGLQLVADMKTMDMGADEVRIAAEAGADLVIVCAAASDGTVRAALRAAECARVQVLVSLMGVRDRIGRTRELAAIGVNRVIAHRGIDDEYVWSDPEHLADLHALLSMHGVRTGLAGGLSTGSIAAFAGLGFERIVVGRGITAARDPAAQVRELIAVVEQAPNGGSARERTT